MHTSKCLEALVLRMGFRVIVAKKKKKMYKNGKTIVPLRAVVKIQTILFKVLSSVFLLPGKLREARTCICRVHNISPGTRPARSRCFTNIWIDSGQQVYTIAFTLSVTPPVPEQQHWGAQKWWWPRDWFMPYIKIGKSFTNFHSLFLVTNDLQHTSQLMVIHHNAIHGYDDPYTSMGMDQLLLPHLILPWDLIWLATFARHVYANRYINAASL